MSRTESGVDELPEDIYNLDSEFVYEEELLEEERLVLRSEDFISGPYRGDNGSLPLNILEFDFSYGYDCKKYYNLVVADEKTLMFISGNFINFFDVDGKDLTFRRSAFGGGLGHITKNPNEDYPHIAIAENGEQPPIIVYEWPTLEIVCLLRGGTAKCFTHLNYSPNGELLVSQGGEPDYLITVWDWKKSAILLRTKSYVNDVYRVLFSPYVPGHLTTCGVSHIKFWKMARTFTGLKLQGELGRFGKTEYSDILGIYPMSDEKVISGCSWGNFLVWEAGLIKLEVFRKLRKRCHEGPIVQFDFKDGELWTVAMDGRIRVWHYDTIDQADPPDEDRVVQLEPIYDFHTPNCEFMCIRKRSHDEEDTFYYAQDGNGGLWLIDLTTELNVKPSIQLYECHAGRVVDIAACPWGNYLVSLGEDGRIYLYNYITRQKLYKYQFPAKGVCMIWLPLSIDASGNVLILGFDDGLLRVIFLEISERLDKYNVTIMQKAKAHPKPLTFMSVNETGSLLVTSGEDKTIFVFMLEKKIQEYISLVPIGLVETTDIVTYITWHKDRDDTVILGCLHGFIDQITVPTVPQDYTTITYVLNAEPIHQRFVTYKAQIRRDIKLREIEARKAAKREKKRVEMEKFKKENPGLEVDEEIFLADSESEEELEPLFIPEIPNKILWIQHTDDGTLWLSVAGYDAGYVYEYFIDQKEEVPYRFRMICDADDVEVSSFLYNHNRKYLIFAMQNGAIRINRVKEDFRDLSDYWQLSMHDNYNGYVPKMCFSYDEQYFFSCGHDGNVFSYKFYPENDEYIKAAPKVTPLFKKVESLYDDDTTYSDLSLEQAIVKAEEDRKTNLANYNKKQYLEKLFALRKEFQQLLKRNQKLPPTQIIPRRMLELDPRITNNLQEKLNAELDLVKRKLAYDVEKSTIRMAKLKEHFIDPLDVFPISVQGINNNLRVTTLRQRKLYPEFYEMHLIVDQKIIEAELKGRPPERPPVIAEVPPPAEKKKAQQEYFLLGLSPSTIQNKLGAKINRLLDKYRQRRTKLEKRQQEWEKFNQLKPIPGVNHPDDEAKLAEAMETIGDYKLKSAQDYKVPKHLRESTVKKYKQLLNMREKQYNLRHAFNAKVYKLRDKKARLRTTLIILTEQLEAIHREIPQEQHIEGPPIVELFERDFPEKNLELVVVLPENKREMVDMIRVVPSPSVDTLEKEVLPCLEGKDFFDEDETISEWEAEAKKIRLKRMVFQQSETVRMMLNKIQSFDNAVEDIYNRRLTVSVDATFLDIHLLTLNQELLILKKSEAIEDVHTDNLHAIMEEMLDAQDLIADQTNKIEARKRDIEVLEEKGKQIQQRFQVATVDNKFYDFLRRIFKKKYKPPKIRDPNDSESESDTSSSSSSSDDDEDAGSIDSREVGPIRLDDSVCPKGCDQALYDMTFLLRGERHEVELEIKEHNKFIESTKKDMEQTFKRMKNIEIGLQQSQEALETFQREKQQKLNQVMCTIVLKLHQLQHLISDTEVDNVKKTLIFSKPMLSKLYKRVGQLQMETLQQRDKHKLNINHLARMKTDCKTMEDKIYNLNNTIEEYFKKKFGKSVDLDEVQEVQLKKLIFDLRMSMLDIRSMYEEELHQWRTKYGKKQLDLKKSLRDNTGKLELLGLLNHEKTKLSRVVQHQEEKRQHLETVAGASRKFKEDIAKLKEIVRTQYRELHMLHEEIRVLKTKGFQPKHELTVVYKGEDIEEEEELELLELDETDDVIEFDYEPTVRPREQVSIIPKINEDTLMARNIILEMLDDLISDEGSVKDIEMYVFDTMRKDSVTQIIDDLLAVLPYEPDDNQQNILEVVAEKLYALKETEDESQSAKEILNAILDRTILHSDAIEDVGSMLNELVRELPTSFILQREIILSIIEKITSSYTDVREEELVDSVLSLTTSQRAEIEAVLGHILKEVYGTGIDYLYYIKDL